MAERGSAVAGVPSERLSQLASPQLANRTRQNNALGAAHSAFNDSMSAILRPIERCSSGKKITPRDSLTPPGYAGKSTSKINNAAFNHGSKKQSPEANESKQIAGLFSAFKDPPPTTRRGTRSLKQYFNPDQLSEAFCTKFHVTDPLSGRTEIMTARRPGRASAEVNVADFDAYMLPKERIFSMQKAKDNIDHDILGLMPKPNTELKFSLGTIARQHRMPTLECSGNWMTPTAEANVCRPLGLSRRHNVFPWTPTDTNNIAHVYGGTDVASPRTTRSCIRPAFISS